MEAWKHVTVEPSAESPSGRGGAAAVAISGRRVLLHGGADRTPLAYSDWWVLELLDGSVGHWTKISPVLNLAKKRKLLPRSGASLTYLPAADGGPGKVYLFGGQCLDTRSWELTDVQPGGQQQRRPPGRHSHVAGPYGQRGVVLFGGAGLRGPLNDVWLFDVDEQEWRCLSADLAEDECPHPREMAAGCMISDAGLLVHGGRAVTGDLLDDIAIFDGQAGRWVLVQATSYPRCAHTACNAAVTPQQQAPGSSGSAEAAATATANDKPQAEGGAAGGEGSSGTASPHASNVLLYGGFTGKTVAGDVLQLSFLRQQHSSGAPSLRAELQPLQVADAPPPRFAHGAAVLNGPEHAEVVIVAGVNQTDDLSSVHMLTV